MLNNLRAVRLKEVIETVVLIGGGTKHDPFRELTQYWTKDGVLLASSDGCQAPRPTTQA
jgi:hypothetical protein